MYSCRGVLPDGSKVDGKQKIMYPTTTGRWAEKGMLRKLVQQLKTKGGGTLMMTGDRGSGKASLLKELAHIGSTFRMIVVKVSQRVNNSSLP